MLQVKIIFMLKFFNLQSLGEKMSCGTLHFKRGKYSFGNAVLLFKLPKENYKHPTFEWRGQGRCVDSFVL